MLFLKQMRRGYTFSVADKERNFSPFCNGKRHY